MYYEAWYASFEDTKYISVEIRIFLACNLVLWIQGILSVRINAHLSLCVYMKLGN